MACPVTAKTVVRIVLVTLNKEVNCMDNIRLSENHLSLWIIDQTLLPNREEWLELSTVEEMYDAIKQLKVRGAPAIGICAGYSLYVLSKKLEALPFDEFTAELKRLADILESSRPTAVNLSWALKRMLCAAAKEETTAAAVSALEKECVAIHQEDIAMCKAISEFGLSLVKDGDGILTHCNAGPLATSRYGTALGPILLGKERGLNFKVFSDETRPLLQGARLTSYELHKAGVDVTLICDNMASIVMKNGWIQACFVGCDRIAANGDFANKIGTSGVAILAKHYGIPFYILGPRSTIDMNCPTGADIKIEQRNESEVTELWYAGRMAPEGVKVYNPAFDVTDKELITAFVTERGVIYPPFDEGFKKLFGEGE